MVRTRMAPSPTGNLHLGTAYATLWPYLWARKNNGVFILRIEDTDRDRSTEEFEGKIIDGLKWLGYDWDEGPYHQMDRLDLYKDKLDFLISNGGAYKCFCTKEELDGERKLQQVEKMPQVYSGRCRNLSEQEILEKKDQSFVIRFKMPSDRGLIEYEDLIHGKITFDSKLIGDFVISRASGIPLYNFVVVVDDAEMKISHVIRGDEHVSNTPKQIVLFEALGVAPPKYGHYAVILEEDRSGKLSKRTGATGIEWYKSEGYLPEVILNYLFLLGVSVPDGEEVYDMQGMTSYFDLDKMIDHPAAWNQQKLDWLNGEYIRKMSDEELTVRLQEFLVDHPHQDKILSVVPFVKERLKKLSDFIPLTNWFFEGTEYDHNVFETLKVDDAVGKLSKVIETLKALPSPWIKSDFEQRFQDLARENGLNNSAMFQLLRVGYTGQLVSPPLFEMMNLEQEAEVIKRFQNAIDFLENK